MKKSLRKLRIKLMPKAQRRAIRARIALIEAYHEFLDAEWYSSTHGLAKSSDPAEHFADVGVARAYAPCPELAGDDGKTLTTLGLELLVRAGVMVGAEGLKPLQGNDNAINAFQISNAENKKIAVVTAIFGDYDKLMPVNPDWRSETDFYLFTDRLFEPHGFWKHVHANYDHEDPRRRARFVKTHLPTYFSDYDWVIWIDGNILICEDPSLTLEKLSLTDCDFATFKHPIRDSLVTEIAACIQLKKENPLAAAKHLAQIHDHPEFHTAMLFETMVMMLRPSAKPVREMCAVWWKMMMRGSKRDQLSLPLAVSETKGLRVGLLPDAISQSPYFAKANHQI